ncbi:ATP phosphoribosyltransferase (plasmid) [Nicoliella spurrieriana]|uniref:ATP phosphoribosyltransferase n=1 Tax=Nicoliella spurrieriana TaxID=2925830 RepID=A0A976RQE3_9LACO|nr:ATP phosphoribosyltransferase [Nicoliella spurrieriana]UQS85925.1 ATP phosphoribosyltransferase [Nicoliella spurrieriana]
MLKIALTKGRVEDKLIPLLEKCGIDCTPLINKKRKLIITLADQYQFILVKGEDVCTYLRTGTADLGVVGSDILAEQDALEQVDELLDLGTGRCQFIVASKQGFDWNQPQRKVIGTKYPEVARRYFTQLGEDVEIIKISGSVELAPLTGLADAIVDLTETGTTLRVNHLVVHDWLDVITSRLVANPVALKQKRREIFQLVDQLNQVVEENEYENI